MKMYLHSPRLIAIVFLVLTLAGEAGAQRHEINQLQKSSPRVLSIFAEVVAKPSRSTVRVRCEGKDAALGTVVGADGWILTKASELKEKIRCRLQDGRTLEAVLVGVDDKFDLALLKVQAGDLTPVEWSDSKLAPVGHWVAAPGTEAEPVAVGVVSVAARTIAGRKEAPPPSPTSGYLGVALDLDFTGVKIERVMPDSGAEHAGIKANDRILAVNGEELASADDLLIALQRLKPGDVVKLRLLRDDEKMEVKATLGKRPGQSRGDLQNSLGSPLSERRTGFPTILQHDAVLKPSDCGGPLVDLDGRVIGINIARAGRTESYAVPSETVRPIVERLKSSKRAVSGPIK